jgi:flagellar biosynthesis/type III secretory pathway protein FliH
MSLHLAPRPWLPPSLGLLLEDEHGTAAGRRQEEERLRAGAFDAGRRRGLEEGLAQGRAEGAAEAAADAARVLEQAVAERAAQGAGAAVAALHRLLERRADDRRALDTDARAALFAALQAVLPALLAHAAGGEIAALLAELLVERGEDVILLAAHPDTLAAMQREGFPELQSQPARIRLLPEPAMPPGAAEASWVSGGVIHRPEALVARALAILAAPDVAPPEPPQEHAP